MAYSVNQKVEAVDYNTLFVKHVNRAWSSGEPNDQTYTYRSDQGYGQPKLTEVRQHLDLIRARAAFPVAGNPNEDIDPTWNTDPTPPEWRTLVNVINQISLHQTGNSAISANSFIASNSLPISTTSPTGLVAWSNQLQTAIDTILGNQRLNSHLRGVPSPATEIINTSGTWSDRAVFTINVNFDSFERARYFFNAGGQIRFEFSHQASNSINTLLSNVATEAGQVYFSSTNEFPISIAGQTYNAVTKTGGGTQNSSTTINNGVPGYHQLTGSLVELFKQSGNLQSVPNDSTSITLSASRNSAGMITFVVVFAESPTDYIMNSGSKVSVTIMNPSTNRLVNTWGIPEITSTVELFQAPLCITPTVGQATSTTIQAAVPFNSSITVSNATSLTLVGAFPSGISATFQKVGNDIVVNISGTTFESLLFYDIKINATNDTVGCLPSNVTNRPTGLTGNVIAPPVCTSPVIGQVTPSVIKPGVPYNGTISVSNATSASVSNLPPGLSHIGTTASGSNLTLTIAGTPTVAASNNSYTITVSATNNCGGGYTTSSTTSTAGTFTSQAADSCPTPVVGQLIEAAAPPPPPPPPPPPVATYSLTADKTSVNEGESVLISLNATNVSNSTLIDYTISGVSSSDISGEPLGGSFLPGLLMSRLIAISADNLTEGVETLTLALNNGQASVQVTINDTSVTAPPPPPPPPPPVGNYSVTADRTTIDETVNRQVIFTLSAANVYQHIVYWRIEAISGNVTSSDFTTAFSGSAFIGDMGPGEGGGANVGEGILVITAQDMIQEGIESFTIKMYSTSNYTGLLATGPTVTIGDTSTTPSPSPPSPAPPPSGGNESNNLEFNWL